MVNSSIFIQLLNWTSNSIHGVAHATTYAAKTRKVGGIGKIFFSEDVRDDDFEGKTRDGDPRLNIELSLCRACACFDTVPRRVVGHRGRCRTRARRCDFVFLFWKPFWFARLFFARAPPRFVTRSGTRQVGYGSSRVARG